MARRSRLDGPSALLWVVAILIGSLLAYCDYSSREPAPELPPPEEPGDAGTLWIEVE